MVVPTFGLITPLKELDEIIERTRQEKDLPGGDWKEKKERLRMLLSMRDGLEPNCKEINEMTREGGLLKIHRELLKKMREDRACSERVKGRPNSTRI